MSDSVTVRTSQSWFGRIGGAIAGVLIGIFLFIAAFPVLIFNEGRAIERAKTLAAGSKQVISVPEAPVDAANEGKLVHVTGKTAVDGEVKDPIFGIAAPAIKLRREAEMYQWTQEEKSETKKNLGGSEETVTTYTYSKKWVSGLVNSSEFQKPEGHANPDQMPVESETFVADEVTVGDYQLPESLVSRIDDYRSLPVPKGTEISSDLPEDTKLVGEGFYLGKDPKTPAVGDVKVSFQVVEPGAVSIVARQVESTFEPYVMESTGGSIEMLQTGTFSSASMFASEIQGEAIFAWIIRVVGFFMMFFGMLLITKPLTVVADVIPFLGSLAEMGAGVIALLVALPLTLLTIALAWLAFRPLIGVPLVLVAGVCVFFGIRALLARRRGKNAPPPLPTAA